MSHLTAVPDIEATQSEPIFEPGTVVIAFGNDDSSYCPDCQNDPAYSPYIFGLDRVDQGRLCTSCADIQRPGLGTLLEGLDQLDGVLACEFDPNRRLVLLAELERAHRWLLDRWLEEET